MNNGSIFRDAFWVLLGGMLIIRTFFALRVHRSGERIMPDKAAIIREGVPLFILRFLLFFLLIALIIAFGYNPPFIRVLVFPLTSWLRWIGVIIGFLSLALLAWTEAELGRYWSAQLQLRNEHHIVTTGPYSHTRHPLYSAISAYGIALALVSASWIFVGLALLMILGLAVRVPKEEQMMIERFGEEYRSYMKRTGRFFPK